MPHGNIMMIGPSRAGKTTLLAVLRLASARPLANGDRVEIRPVNAEARELFAQTRDIIKTGAITPTPTIGAVRYTFELTCDVEKRVLVEHFEEKPRFFGRPELVNKSYYELVKETGSFTLTVLDGKGGDVFDPPGPLDDPEEYKTRRAELVKLAAESFSLVICVNSEDPDSTGRFFGSLQEFLDEVHKDGVRTPFERVVIVLTQADRAVEQYGSNAQTRLQEMDPAVEASKTLGYYAKHGLFQALGTSARDWVYAGWVSVYGFIPNEGSVNFDSENNRIAIFRPGDARWTDEWVPYGVIEPFLFACTGAFDGLKKMT